MIHLILIAIYIGLVCLMTGWTDGNLEFVLGLIKGVPVDVPIWVSFLVMLLLGPICLAFNIITTLVYYFVF